MIQRIQTLWLLLAAACTLATFKFAFFTYTKDGATQYFNATGSFLIMLVTGIVAGLAIFNIGLFKNRSLQLKLCILGMLLDALLIFLYYNESQKITGSSIGLAAILHSIIVILFFLAAKGIHRDSKLVKQSDKLR